MYFALSKLRTQVQVCVTLTPTPYLFLLPWGTRDLQMSFKESLNIIKLKMRMLRFKKMFLIYSILLFKSLKIFRHNYHVFTTSAFQHLSDLPERLVTAIRQIIIMGMAVCIIIPLLNKFVLAQAIHQMGSLFLFQVINCDPFFFSTCVFERY